LDLGWVQHISRYYDERRAGALAYSVISNIILSKYQILLSKLEVDMTNYTTVKVSKRYQIAVPSLARKLLNIKSGDRLLVDIQDGMMVLIPEPENYTEAMAGMHKEIWQGVDAQEYIDEERNAWTGLLKD
jgi:AbrB family looped-hinge helix DNA binding protein